MKRMSKHELLSLMPDEQILDVAIKEYGAFFILRALEMDDELDTIYDKIYTDYIDYMDSMDADNATKEEK